MRRPYSLQGRGNKKDSPLPVFPLIRGIEGVSHPLGYDPLIVYRQAQALDPAGIVLDAGNAGAYLVHMGIRQRQPQINNH